MTRERRLAVRREVRVVLLLLALALFTGLLLASGWDLVGYLRGATVDAEVVSIRTNAPGRRVYDIRLVTRSGRVCVTEVDSGSNPPPREIRVGGLSRVHYSSHNACADYSVEESTESSPVWWVVFASLPIAACLFELRRLRCSQRKSAGS